MKKLLSIILCILILVSTTLCAMTTVFAASNTYLRGTFNNWDTSYQMMDVGNNNYQYTLNLKAGTYEYKYADADWTVWNTPSENLSLSISKDSTIVFEVNRNTNLNQATVISGDTSYVVSQSPIENVKFTLAWPEHNKEMLSEGTTNKVQYTESESPYVYWNLIPDAKDNSKFYIQNANTKNYIYHEKSTLNTSINKIESDNKYLWNIDLSTGYARIMSCDTEYSTQTINLESQGGYAELSFVPAFYMSSQFTPNKELITYQYTLSPNGVKDTRGDVVVNSPTSMTSKAVGKTWTKTENTSSLPTFKAAQTPLLEAVYNLSAEEVIKNEFESKYGTAFYTGESWKKVWTRDTAMSCEFSLADVLPQIALNCAKEKVVGPKGKEVFEEDTGTGGSYPVSSDRIITMLSVWEIYLSTGDKSVLSYFYPICENTINQDLNVVWDEKSGLFKGETCGTDWRDQTYPDWVSETKQNGLETIADSKAASVNIIYSQVYDIMAKSAEILGKSSEVIKNWSDKSTQLKENISKRLFSDELNVYAAWEYADYMGSVLPYKADVISNGYALLFNVGTDKQIESILKNYPLVTYGAPTVFPQKQGDLANKDKIYHNFGIWPGWEAIMMLGAKKQNYNSMSEEIWNSCIRGAATSLTNKEVINYLTGEGVESNRQLWSIAGTLSGYYKVLFGMEYDKDGLSFDPYIPSWCKGPFSLTNFPYQKATLNLTLTGSGNTIKKITVNGQEYRQNYKLPLGATGTYNIQIEMEDNKIDQPINLDDNYNHAIAPKMPTLTIKETQFWWSEEPGNKYYVFDGINTQEVSGKKSHSIDNSEYHCYTVFCIDKNGIKSELSQPVVSNVATKIEAESGTYKAGTLRTKPSGYSGSGVIDDPVSTSSPVTIKYTAPKDGTYLLSCCYNNKGEPTSSNTCGIRSVYIDGKDVGSLVFPIMNFYYQMSSKLVIPLTKGIHEITIKYDDANFYDRNMNINTNNVQYDYFTITDISNFYQKEKDMHICGDAKVNNKIEIIDATSIQQKLAHIEVTDFSELYGDADENKKLEILDATYIQQYLARIPTTTRVGQVIEY